MKTTPITALALALSAPVFAQGPKSPTPVADLHLNEVMFDPTGRAGSDNVWQYVELVASRTVSTSGMTLEDHRGRRLVRLPTHTLQPGEFMVVLLGEKERTLENSDPEDGPYAVTAGSGFGAYLGVEEGGVRLRDGSGAMLDQVYWGSNGAVGQPFVDLSYAGGAPFAEGDSIGRRADYAPGSAGSSWAISGGLTANGPSLGLPNVVALPFEEDLVLYQDSLLNEVFTSLAANFENQHWLDVVMTRPTVVSYSAVGDVAKLVALHSFDLVINGAPVTMSGSVSTTFTRTTTPGATGEDFVVTGSLGDGAGQYGLAIDAHCTTAGRHGRQATDSQQTTFTWTQNGVDYTANVAGTATVTHLDDVQTSTTEQRSGSDWGGAGTKTATSSILSIRLGDGNYRQSSTLQRSYPGLPPMPGGSQTPSGELEQIVQEQTYVLGDGGMLESGSITRYDHTVGSFVFLTLQPGATGTLSMTQTVVGNGVDFVYMQSYPALNGVGESFVLTAEVRGSIIEQNGKELTLGSAELRAGSTLVRQSTFAIDPPVAQDPEKPEEKPSWWKRAWKGTKKFAGTALLCVGGGVAGQAAAGTKRGGAAIVKVAGKKLGTKLIPVVGQVTTALCVLQAAGDAIVGE